MRIKASILLAIVLLFSACQPKDGLTLSGLNKKNFQTEVDGKSTELVVITNKQGLEACITNYGARLVSLMVPDKKGNWEDVVTGFPTIDEYLSQDDTSDVF